jgi:hypothetical protein
MKMKDFPKEIFVVREQEGKEEEYLEIRAGINDLAAWGETRLVAVYKLVAVCEAQSKVELITQLVVPIATTRVSVPAMLKKKGKK